MLFNINNIKYLYKNNKLILNFFIHITNYITIRIFIKMKQFISIILTYVLIKKVLTNTLYLNYLNSVINYTYIFLLID